MSMDDNVREQIRGHYVERFSGSAGFYRIEFKPNGRLWLRAAQSKATPRPIGFGQRTWLCAAPIPMNVAVCSTSSSIYLLCDQLCIDLLAPGASLRRIGEIPIFAWFSARSPEGPATRRLYVSLDSLADPVAEVRDLLEYATELYGDQQQAIRAHFINQARHAGLSITDPSVLNDILRRASAWTPGRGTP